MQETLPEYNTPDDMVAILVERLREHEYCPLSPPSSYSEFCKEYAENQAEAYWKNLKAQGYHNNVIQDYLHQHCDRMWEAHEQNREEKSIADFIDLLYLDLDIHDWLALFRRRANLVFDPRSQTSAPHLLLFPRL